MYTTENFKTKKALREAIKAGARVTFFQPGYMSINRMHTDGKQVENGTITLEGPHYPAPHSWYAQATVKDGLVIKVS